MAHRDDHDAALARADALQAELDREREAHAEQSDKIARLEAELAAAKARLARAEDALGDLRPRKPVAADAALSTSTARPPGETSGQGVVIGMGAVVVVLLIGGLAAGRCDGRSASEEKVTSPPRPQPPFVADALLREGLDQVTGDLALKSIAFDYVRADGMLDPEHGTIQFQVVKRRPPPPPDDPDRPTGAPVPSAGHDLVGMMMAECPQPRWSPHTGWTASHGSCMSLGEEPARPPTCSPHSVLGRARAEGAPDGLARIHVDWAYLTGESGLQRGWRWTFSITDHPRGIDFQRTYDDRDCPRPPVER